MSRVSPAPAPSRIRAVPLPVFSPDAPSSSIPSSRPRSSTTASQRFPIIESVESEDKENVAPPEPAGLLFSPTATTHEKERSAQTTTLGFRLGIDDADYNAGDGDFVLVPKAPRAMTMTKVVLSVFLDQKLRRKTSASSLSSATDQTSDFGLSRCSSPTRPPARPRNSGGSGLSRLIHSEDPDKWAKVEDYVAARSATPVGAICPLPVPETLGLESLIIAESPRPLGDGVELPAEDIAMLREVLDAAAGDEDEDVNEVKQKEWPLTSGSTAFPIELLPDSDPEWEDSGVIRDG